LIDYLRQAPALFIAVTAGCELEHSTDRLRVASVVDYGSLPTQTEIGGYRFYALRSPAELFAESTHMQHCVRTYTS
jgi:hypothetical protein